VRTPLVPAAELARLLEAGGDAPALLDVRWELGPGARRDLFVQAHIPGAAFVDLDVSLAGAPGEGGRHPLPAAADFESAMRAAGVSSGRAVTVYDQGSSLAAARGWWLLRYFGHPDVMVLDGGLAAWLEAGLPAQTGDSDPAGGGDFAARPGQMPVLDADGAAALARRGALLDARAAERFRGEVEPLDPVAGHIPGARNRPTALNLDASGRFRAPAELRRAFAATGVGSATEAGAYCGSGITAAHEVLALELAGFEAALYPGSWSEWIRDPRRPVATGTRADGVSARRRVAVRPGRCPRAGRL
jgi:thiosulfate/3-mercaptopyruvate sulfurtransferase